MSLTIKKITDINPSLEDLLDLDKKYKYQTKLTAILERKFGDFDQAWVNQVVLWKTNRYAQLSEKTLELLNHIERNADILDEAFTKEVLTHLLGEPGIRLPMASTILRFINPNIYQIIDQRAYRVITGKPLKLTYKTVDDIDTYLIYIEQLKSVCEAFQIEFRKADRILYQLDKKKNEKINLNN